MINYIDSKLKQQIYLHRWWNLSFNIHRTDDRNINTKYVTSKNHFYRIKYPMGFRSRDDLFLLFQVKSPYILLWRMSEMEKFNLINIKATRLGLPEFSIKSVYTARQDRALISNLMKSFQMRSSSFSCFTNTRCDIVFPRAMLAYFYFQFNDFDEPKGIETWKAAFISLWRQKSTISFHDSQDSKIMHWHSPRT